MPNISNWFKFGSLIDGSRCLCLKIRISDWVGLIRIIKILVFYIWKPLKSAQTWWDCWGAGPGAGFGWSLRIPSSSGLNSLHLSQSVPVKPRCTGSSRHHICVISPTIRLQGWVMMKKFYFSNKTSLVLLLGGFFLPSSVRGEEQEMLLGSCSAFLGHTWVLLQLLASWNSMAVDLENSIYFFFLFYSFVSMFGWTLGFLTQQSHIHIYKYICICTI